MTSIRSGMPGRSFAARVARVTPSLILKWPPFPGSLVAAAFR
jgi:hypothetical protein